MTRISNEEFKKQLEERRINSSEWRLLKSGTIYTITNAEFINTQPGEVCILTLGDGKKALAPPALMNYLKRGSQPFPRYLRPKGIVQSKYNRAHLYHDNDLV